MDDPAPRPDLMSDLLADPMLRGNLHARLEASRFRQARAVRPARLDKAFQDAKRDYPVFGFVDVVAGPARVAMFAANDDLIALTYFWFGPDSYETGSMALWCAHAAQARTVFDIGAFSGVYGLVAAHIAPGARIHAFEPARRTAARLLVNVQANRMVPRFEINISAVSDAVGEARFLQYRGDQILGNGGSLVDKGKAVVDGSERVEITTLDAYCAQSGAVPDLIKIDVEQNEVRTLEGARATIASARPVMLIEVAPGTVGAVDAFLREHGYTARTVDEATGETRPLNPADVTAVLNVLALPG